MSIIIHTIGTVTCATFAVAWMKSLYRDATREPNQPFNEALPEHHYLLADTVGIGLAITGYGLDRAEEATDKLFDSHIVQWAKNKCKRLQIQPDGEYFEYKFGDWHDNGWNGYTTDRDIPKYKPGKFEMEV